MNDAPSSGGGGGGGGISFIENQSYSAVSSVTFSTGLAAKYLWYKIIGTNQNSALAKFQLSLNSETPFDMASGTATALRYVDLDISNYGILNRTIGGTWSGPSATGVTLGNISTINSDITSIAISVVSGTMTGNLSLFGQF